MGEEQSGFSIEEVIKNKLIQKGLSEDKQAVYFRKKKAVYEGSKIKISCDEEFDYDASDELLSGEEYWLPLFYDGVTYKALHCYPDWVSKSDLPAGHQFYEIENTYNSHLEFLESYLQETERLSKEGDYTPARTKLKWSVEAAKREEGVEAENVFATDSLMEFNALRLARMAFEAGMDFQELKMKNNGLAQENMEGRVFTKAKQKGGAKGRKKHFHTFKPWERAVIQFCNQQEKRPKPSNIFRVLGFKKCSKEITSNLGWEYVWELENATFHWNSKQQLIARLGRLCREHSKWGENKNADLG